MSFTPTAPNHVALVRQTAQDFPAEFNAANRDGVSRTHREAFINILAGRLFSVDARFGLNGKRGTNVLSGDAVAFKNPQSPAGGVEIIDTIVNSKGPGPRSPDWSDVTQETIDAETIGKWIQPGVPGPPEPPPPPPPPPVDADHEAVMLEIRRVEMKVDKVQRTLDRIFK